MTLSKMPPIGVNFVAAAFLVSIASAAAAGAAEVAQKREAARPNIVLIMADDFGYECVTCNGGQSYQTPRLDAMAAGGMRFTECRSQPVCTPTRVQIMTGRCNSRNYWAFGSLHPKELTFGHILGAAGYATCITGKWHVGGAEHSSEAIVGFDEYCLWEGQKEQGTRRIARPAEARRGLGGRFDHVAVLASVHRQKPRSRPHETRGFQPCRVHRFPL